MVSDRDAEDLLRNADTAMYMAKESGKGHYQIFQPDMHARALARLELKSDLQRALDCGEFTLRYQPIMDLRRGDIAGMEALVRWQHPTRGLVQPGDFIPLLEDTGLIVPVGRFVLREACQWAAVMQKECPRDPPLSIAVNVSATQLQRPEFIDEVRCALRDSGIPPDPLTLELTESVMMQDLEVSLLRLNALRALGVKLAIDDFGTGYSSLNYLRQFPMDILKIDRSFLMDPNPDSEELTEAIVALARIFKLEAVAEGVESGGQVAAAAGNRLRLRPGIPLRQTALAPADPGDGHGRPGVGPGDRATPGGSRWPSRWPNRRALGLAGERRLFLALGLLLGRVGVVQLAQQRGVLAGCPRSARRASSRREGAPGASRSRSPGGGAPRAPASTARGRGRSRR